MIYGLNHFHTQINKGLLKKAGVYSGQNVVLQLTTIKMRTTVRKITQKILHIVTWCPTEKIEIRLLLFPVRELTVGSRQSKEYGSEWRPTDVGTL